MSEPSVGQLLLDKYGRLGMIIEVGHISEYGDETVQIEWLIPPHGRMLIQTHKLDELRLNYLVYRQWLNNP